jgi:hypothetical protein
MRKIDDLPQPDGPSNTASVPFSIVKETSATAAVSPQSLVTELTATLVTAGTRRRCDHRIGCDNNPT